MEVRNFIQTQLQPLMVCCSFMDNTSSLVLDANQIMTCGEWVDDDFGVSIPHLMSIDVGIGVDLSHMSESDIKSHPIISIIAKIPESFYWDATDELATGLSKIIRDQIITFFDNQTLSMVLGDHRFDPRHELSSNDWTFKIRHGISIVPYVTADYNLGFRVNV